VKIILCANTSWYLWNYRVGLIRALLAAGNEINILAPLDQTSENLVNLGCNVYSIPMNRKGSNLLQEVSLVLKFYNYVRSARPDILIAFTIKPVIYMGLIARVLSIPIVSTITGLGTTFIRNNWLTKVVKWLYKLALASAQHVLFQNPEDQNLFLDAGLVQIRQAEQISGSGIDLVRFAFSPIVTTNDTNPTVFLLAGRMLWDKGIKEYVEAAKIVKDLDSNVEFQLLGEIGSDNISAIPQKTISSWQQEGIVHYLGVASDVRTYMEQADCVVLPSYREGLSRTLLEAGAIGRPVVATRVVGCKDVVDDGKTGLLCNPRDPFDLAEKLLTFIDLSRVDRAKMGQEARAKIEKEFDEKNVIQRYCDIVSHNQ
jgi:glycosyltransferase involved in cell wall biosynthesis